MKTYRLDKFWSGLLVLGLFFLFWTYLLNAAESTPRLALFAVWFSALLYYVLRYPYRITVDPENKLIFFKSIFGKKTLAPGEVRSVREGVVTVVLIHREGECQVSLLINGAADIKHYVREFNPKAEWSGISQLWQETANGILLNEREEEPAAEKEAGNKGFGFRDFLIATLAILTLLVVAAAVGAVFFHDHL